jgi:prophage regulatory protein
MENNVYLTDNQLAARFGVARGTVWRWNKLNPDFPRVIKLSDGCARWSLHEVEAFEKARATQRGVPCST